MDTELEVLMETGFLLSSEAVNVREILDHYIKTADPAMLPCASVPVHNLVRMKDLITSFNSYIISLTGIASSSATLAADALLDISERYDLD